MKPLLSSGSSDPQRDLRASFVNRRSCLRCWVGLAGVGLAITSDSHRKLRRYQPGIVWWTILQPGIAPSGAILQPGIAPSGAIPAWYRPGWCKHPGCLHHQRTQFKLKRPNGAPLALCSRFLCWDGDDMRTSERPTSGGETKWSGGGLQLI